MILYLLVENIHIHTWKNDLNLYLYNVLYSTFSNYDNKNGFDVICLLLFGRAR